MPRMRPRPLSLLAALGALLVAAWFALGGYQAHELDQVTNLVNARPRLTAAQTRSALSQLRSAALLNPNREVLLLRARVYGHSGEPAKARRIAESAVAAEPRNVEAWYVLATVAHGRRLTSALHHVAVLAPSRPR